MNYNNFEQETSRMLELMKYGVNESTSKSSAPRVEYSVKAADGLTYGIVCEGTKFYIKSAPKKDTPVVNEDFDYIGGEMNKKLNEYKSYSSASKNLELMLMQINESHKENKIIVETTRKGEPADWQINETVEMRNAINRMNQISRNVGMILTEGSIPSDHTLPEAPAKNPSQDKVNSPFTDTAVANGEKEFTKKETNYEKPNGTPYSKSANAQMTSLRKPTMSGDNGNAYTESSDNHYYDNDSVADKKPSGGKVTRADENKKRRTIKLTEEQVLAWNNSSDDYMDKSNGTQVGSSSPYEDELEDKYSNQGEADTDPIREAEGPVYNSDTTLYPNGGTGEVAHDGDPFKEKKGSKAEAEHGVIAESDFDDEDIAGFDGYDDEDNSDVPFPEVEDDYMPDDEKDDAIAKADSDIADNADYFDGVGEDEYGDGYVPVEDMLAEALLNDFGKHPAYRKKPMTTPPNKEVAPNGEKDWNDESAKGEEPFGKKIGSSAPYERLVQKVTNSVMESLGF